MLRHYMATVIVLWLIDLGRAVQVRTCKKNNDCGGSCEFCVEGPGDIQTVCKVTHPDIYRPGSGCVLHTEETCPLKCDVGRCRTTGRHGAVYVPYCYCQHGTRPDAEVRCLKTPASKPTVLAVRKEIDEQLINPCVKTNLNIEILAPKDDLLADLQIYYKVAELPFREYPTKMVTVARQEDLVYSTKLNLQLLFPYKTDERTYRFKGNYVGYNTNAFLDLFSDGNLVYSSSWDTFVSYKSLKCTPFTVQLSNCGTSPERSVTYRRRSELLINIVIKLFPGSCPMSEITSWMIWELVHGRISYAPQYDGNSATRSISFRPYELKFGSYAAEVTNAYSGVATSGWCYFRVTCERLVADIREGSSIMGGAEGLYLRADRSYDPNRPTNEQRHVKVEWSCDNSDLIIPICEPKILLVDETFFVPSDQLTPGNVYIFTAKVWTDLYDETGECMTSHVSPAIDHITVTPVSDPKPADQYGDIFIECRQNCGPKVIPSRKLFLEVVEGFNIFHDVEYEWTYYALNEQPTSTDQIRESGVSNTLLVIRANALNAGTKYTVGVKKKNSSWHAEYSFETYSIDFKGSCSIHPESGGIKGQTAFQINCTVDSGILQSSFVFEYYDRQGDDEGNAEHTFSGRMLGTSNDGLLNNIRLTRGHVFVFIFDEHGLYFKVQVMVKLSDWDIDFTDLNALYNDVSDQLQYGGSSTAMELLSVIPDIIPPGMDENKNSILNTLLGFISRIPLHTLNEVKLSVSTLSNILILMNKTSSLLLSPNLMADILKVIKQQSGILFQNVVNDQGKNIDTEEVILILKSNLDAMEAVLLCKDSTYENIDEEDIDPSTARRLREGSMYVEETLNIVTRILGFVQVSGHLATSISSQNDTFIIWIVVAYNIDMMPELISRESGIPIVFGQKLRDYLRHRKNKNEDLALHVISSKSNFFWWRTSFVQSRLVSVTMNRQRLKSRTFPIRFVDEPMDIILKLDNKLKHTIVEGNVRQLDPYLDPVRLDLALKVYKVDIPHRSVVSIIFAFPSTTKSLRVYADDQLRPDYSAMKKEALTITEASPVYHVPYNDYDEPYFLFMAVMPGPEVEVNQSVTFTFQVDTSLCQTWVEGHWSSVGCRVKSVDSGQLICQCTHFSIFAAAFPVPPNTLDPFGDAKLFLSVTENPIVVGLVVAILLLYLLLALLCCRSDRENKKKGNVIFLDDNLPTDEVPYLIAVYTSARCNSGTSSHVGIRLIGNVATSQHHILLSKQRPVLQTNSDDWFLLFCPEPLGELQFLHLWHDHYGPNPEWLCNKICVFDLQKESQTTFVVNEWLALRMNQLPELIVISLVSENLTDVRSLFFRNIVLGFREKHIIMSVLASHPREEVLRHQRLTVFLCGVMAAMLCNIMFYLPEDGREHVDEYYYSIGSRELYVGIQTAIICLLVNFIIILFFKRSYKNTYRKLNTKRRDAIMTSDKSVMSHPRRASIVKSMRYTFVKLMLKTVQTHPLTPVTLPDSESTVEVQRFWLILAWTSSITILVVCSYLTMLYGLKLGTVSSQEWLSSVVIGIGQEILFLTPAKIIFMSIILATGFRPMLELNIHNIPIEEAVTFNRTNDPEHILEVIERRKHLMYKPMSSHQRHRKLRKKEAKKKWWTLSDFIASVILAVVLNKVIVQLWISHFYTNTQNVNLITRKLQNTISSINFFSVNDITTLDDYLEFTLVSSIYNLRWYNGKVLNEDNANRSREYWTTDYSHRLIGLPRVRQFRMVPKTCNNIVLKAKCIPHWLASLEDTDDYGERWKPVLWSDVSRPSSPWKYTEKSDGFLPDFGRTYGPSGNLYHSGGYTETLASSRKLSELKLGELRRNSWLDVRTRAVIVELTLCNVNTHLLSHVTLVVEYSATGNTLLQAKSVSVDTEMTLTFWHALFFVITVYYLHRYFRLINRDSSSYFPLSSNACRGTIIVLMISSMTLFFAHFYQSSGFYEEFESDGLERYFDFDSFVLYSLILRFVLCLLLSASILHMIALLRVGRRVLNHVYIFRLSLWSTLWVTVRTVLVVLLLSYSAPTELWPSPAEVVMTNSLKNLDTYARVKLFVIVKTVLIAMCSWLYVATFVWHSRLAKAHLPRSGDINYISFVIQHLVKRNK